ncbi:MAG: hypothetical protein R3C18_26335 [Planctomycetaceae bacterium]
MNESVRQQVRLIVQWSVITFVVVNAFSWNPGWGGRNDRKPGREVERYLGWPACYYCDLWRSDHSHEIALPLYFPPVPLSREMSFVYHSFSLMALLMNVALVICGAVIVVILVQAEHGVRKKWMKPVCIGLAIIGGLIMMFGDKFSTHL